MPDNSAETVDFFISRAGRQNAFAKWLAALLRAQGRTVILQDTDFKSRDFLDAMHDALKRCRRTIAIYSPEYLESEYCKAEWEATIGEDIANASLRLVPLMLEPCVPDGLLRRIAYKPLPDIRRRNDKRLLIAEILDWLEVPLLTLDGVPEMPEGTLIARQPVVHPDIYEQKDFAGRADLMAELARRVGTGGTVLTNARQATQAISGLGGVGKTTLARQFAWLYQDAYEGVWWVRAERRETMLRDIVELGGRFSTAIAQLALKDLEAAVTKTIEWIEGTPSERPWLVVYDNVESSGALDKLVPRKNAHVLVTTREPELRGIPSVIDVDVFPPDVATEFLMTRTGRRADAHREAAARLAAAVHYLPLALDHAGSYCVGAGMEFDEYRRNLGDLLREKPSKGASVGRYPESVYGTFTLAIEKAADGCPAAETLMGIAAYLAPERIPIALFDEKLMSVVERGRAIEALGAVSLVDKVELEEGGFALNVHRLVQVVMQGSLVERGEAEETAAEATGVVQRGYVQAQTFESIHRNARWLPHAVAVIEHAPEAGAAAYSTFWTYIQIGDMRVRLGELGVALAAYESARDLAAQHIDHISDDKLWHRNLSISHERIGDVLRAQGDLSASLAAFRSGLEIAETLARESPTNSDRQGELAQSHCWVGMVLQDQGKLDEALDYYQLYQEGIDQLAKEHPENVVWQRDLSVAHNKIGDVLRAQGNLPEALDAFKTSLAIRERLAIADPGNAGWQRDLSVSHNKIGDVLRDQSNLPAALDAFNADLAIAERLAKADPGNAGWQHDVALSLQRVGLVAVQQGELEAALAHYQRGLGIMQKLVALSPDHAAFKTNLAWFEARIAELEASGERPDEQEADNEEAEEPAPPTTASATAAPSTSTTPPPSPPPPAPPQPLPPPPPPHGMRYRWSP